MAKITNGRLDASIEPLNSLMVEKMPARTAHRMARNGRIIETALADYRGALAKLTEDHAARDEQGAIVPGTDASGQEIPGTTRLKEPAAFYAAVKDLLAIEIDLDVLPVPLNDLLHCQLTPRDLGTLDWLITDEDPK